MLVRTKRLLSPHFKNHALGYRKRVCIHDKPPCSGKHGSWKHAFCDQDGITRKQIQKTSETAAQLTFALRFFLKSQTRNSIAALVIRFGKENTITSNLADQDSIGTAKSGHGKNCEDCACS